MENNNVKYAWAESVDSQNYQGSFDTIDECKKEALECVDDNVEHIFVGKEKSFKASDFVDADVIISNADEDALETIDYDDEVIELRDDLKHTDFGRELDTLIVKYYEITR